MMNEIEKQEKINKRMAALRAKRKPPKLANVHHTVKALPDDNTLSYANVRKWIKSQEGIVKSARLTERSRNADISQKDKDKAMRTRIGAQAYIRSIKNYISTGDWSTMYYGEFEDQLMQWVTVAPVGKDINSNNN
jgi:head-tail adaptor